MKDLTGCIKILVLVISLLLAATICVGQEDTTADFRIKLKGYTFDPLESPPAIPQDLKLVRPVEGLSYQIIQFKRPLRKREIEMLKTEYGLSLSEYIPNYAYLEKIDAKTLGRLKESEIFRTATDYQPAFKISPGIGKLEFRTPERQAMTDLWLRGKLFDDADTSAVRTALRNAGGKEIKFLDDRAINGALRVVFKLPAADSLAAAARIEGVKWIEEIPESFRDNGNTAGTMQSGTPGTTPVWDHGINGEGQIIGIMDSPIDMGHCMFEDPTDNTIRPAHRKVVGYRNGSGEAVGDHGTFTAGIAAGDDSNNPGTGGNRGNAWAAKLTYGNDLDVRVNNLRSMLSALNAAHADGAFIHSNSWHEEPNPQYDQIAEDVDNFIWNNEDHLVLGSSGNAGESIGPPGTAKNALCVSATERDPNEMNFGDGNDGPTPDNRRKPDLFAPGCEITSAEVSTACNIVLDQNIWTWLPTPICATSWSCPAASAAATLVRQYYLEGWYPSGTKQPHNGFTPSGALIKATLLNSTVDMTGIAGYPADREGWGLIMLDNSLYFDGDARNVWVWDVRNKNGLFTGQSHNYTIDVVGNTEPLKITLVWAEPPASSGSATPTINDLNLLVTDPNATTFFGNNFAAGQSSAGGAADDVNNVEQILINTPVVGEYVIQIEADEVNQGNPGQGYALVVAADTPEPPIPIGDQNTLVVRVGMSDVMAGEPPPLTTVQNIMTDVVNYVDAASYGEATIVPEYPDPVTLDHTSGHYDAANRNVLIEMATEVIDKLVTADPNVFDKGTPAPGDDIDRMLIVLNDQDFTDDWATTGPWPYDLPGGLTRRISVSVNTVWNDPEERFGHAMGHHFGLVDLYDYPNFSFSQPHVDEWDNMAKPFTGSDFMAWNKERATWITSHGSDVEYIQRPGAGVTYNNTIGINFLSSTATNTKAIAIGMTEGAATIEDEDVFYWIEARTNSVSGIPDDILPEEGVLLYYVDDGIPQGQGPVRITDDHLVTTHLQDAAFEIGDSKTVTGRGLQVDINAGTGAADRNIVLSYDPPETDNDVNIRKGSPSWTSPDIWIDSQKDGFDEDMGRTPEDRGDQPVTGEVNRIYVRVQNPGPGDAYDFTINIRVSEPYHTVGGEADFNVDGGSIYVDKLEPANSPFVDYVEWTPVEDGDPHSCAWVEIPNVFNDVNPNNNSAQQNLEEIPSTQASPYESVTYKFGFSNPDDTKELFYFRAEDVPAEWTAEFNPAKAYLNPHERIECALKITPHPDAPVCTEHRISVTSWTPRGNTLIQVGGGTIQVDLRNNTDITISTELTDCTKEHISEAYGGAFAKYNKNFREYQACLAVEVKGCTNPPRPHEEIIIRYEHPSGYPVYRTVITDEFGCYSDFLVVAEGGVWEVGAEYPGSDCSGPAIADTEVQIDLLHTNDQDGDGLEDDDEPQGDHDGDRIIGIFDPDSDNDGIIDGDELPGDCDKDGHRNVVDNDSDNDGIIDGQDPDPYEGCEIEFRKFSLSLHGGAAVPTGKFANSFDPGFNILVDLDYHFRPSWSLVALLGYNDFKSKISGIADNYWINLSANLRYQRPLQYPWHLYIGGGPGFYIPEKGDSEFGGNIGFGVDYRFRPNIDFEWGIDYHAIFDPEIQFIHTHMGVIFRF